MTSSANEQYPSTDKAPGFWRRHRRLTLAGAIAICAAAVSVTLSQTLISKPYYRSFYDTLMLALDRPNRGDSPVWEFVYFRPFIATTIAAGLLSVLLYLSRNATGYAAVRYITLALAAAWCTLAMAAYFAVRPDILAGFGRQPDDGWAAMIGGLGWIALRPYLYFGLATLLAISIVRPGSRAQSGVQSKLLVLVVLIVVGSVEVYAVAKPVLTFRRILSVQVAKRQFDDEWRKVGANASFSHFKDKPGTIDFIDYEQLKGDRLQALLKLKDVQTLELSGTNLTDDDLRCIVHLTPLRSLRLAGTQITDAGLSNLAQLTNLNELLLGKTKIGDAGVAKLSHLKSLRTLDLSKTQVTDASIKTLVGFPNLNMLQISGSKISEDGREKLRERFGKDFVR